MCSMASLLLASCYNDDYETGTDKTKAGKIAYDYTKAAITPFMDILTLTYKFNRYIGQENLDGRDSVDLLYFPNVKVNRTQDGPEKATVYLLRTFRSGYNRADYTVAIHNTDRHRTLDGKGATWKIHAFSEIYGDSMVYEMSIVSCGQDKWQVTQSHCAPWHMNRKVSRESAQKIYGYRHFFFCQNNHWTVEWEQPPPPLAGLPSKGIGRNGKCEKSQDEDAFQNHQTIENGLGIQRAAKPLERWNHGHLGGRQHRQDHGKRKGCCGRQENRDRIYGVQGRVAKPMGMTETTDFNISCRQF